MHYEVALSRVCPSKVVFDLDGDKVHNVAFTGGCSGNLKAIGKVIDGMTVEQIEGHFLGNTCGSKPTSCADQLAKVLRATLDASK